MTMSYLILGVYRHGQRFDCRQVKGVELSNVLISVFHALHRGLEREIKDQEKRNDDAYKTKIDSSGIAYEQNSNRRSAKVVQGQPHETAAPNLEGVGPSLQRDPKRNQPTVQTKVCEREESEGREDLVE
jgi:hypothetical protein